MCSCQRFAYCTEVEQAVRRFTGYHRRRIDRLVADGCEPGSLADRWPDASLDRLAIGSAATI
ncbi:hypothetical protein M673_21840 (plasmid) [Aureimonas sp. AU20]|nr:hypothetical protein M673_21840 [Aureimonas sp. AU20]